MEPKKTKYKKEENKTNKRQSTKSSPSPRSMKAVEMEPERLWRK